MAAMLAGAVTILLSWQLIDPLKWNRNMLETDQDGLPTRSVGRCTAGTSGNGFLVALFAFVIGSLLYSLYLAYVTRHHRINLPDSHP